MVLRRLLPLVFVALVGCSSAAGDRAAEFADLPALLDSLMTEHRVPGVSLAVFDDTGVLYHHVAGFKSQESQELVDAETAFEAASISKPVFAYIVLTLARDGVLDLDVPFSVLGMDLPSVSHDARWEALTPRMLLSHVGGLPNWRARLSFEAESYEELFSPDDTLKFVSEPNTQYGYSGEGYVLLQQVVEQLTGKGLKMLAREMVFDPLEMERSSFSYDDRIKINTPRGHDRDMNPDKWEIALPLASSTLHTTALDLAAFGIHLASGIRQGEYYSVMAEPAVTVGTASNVERSWGLGLGIITDELGRYVYHGGNNVIFIADFIYGIEENLGYALLTNSANGRAVVEGMERRMFGRDFPR
ncbi:MAG: serine hydrolase [Gemmatimonadetes bacterium]|nr:serine hydrolase [Gemmatimonadota bacterium]